jgi:hypothetical protein
MAIEDSNCSNHPDTMKAMVGETIVGVIADYESNWWLIVESGHAMVFSSKSGAFWVEQPDAVKRLIAKRKADLGVWAAEAERLMTIERALS